MKLQKDEAVAIACSLLILGVIIGGAWWAIERTTDHGGYIREHKVGDIVCSTVNNDKGQVLKLYDWNKYRVRFWSDDNGHSAAPVLANFEISKCGE